jgi:hypothetical protein
MNDVTNKVSRVNIPHMNKHFRRFGNTKEDDDLDQHHDNNSPGKGLYHMKLMSV